MSARIFYALNGLEFDYDRTIKEILKELATDEASVDADTVVPYLQEHTEPLTPEYEATINLWLSRIEESERHSNGVTPDRTDEKGDHEPNDYDNSSRSED